MRALRVFPWALVCALGVAPTSARAQAPAKATARPTKPSAAELKLDALKKEAIANVDGLAKQAQVMVDSVFSFGELGFQEVETSRYLTEILEKNGFTVRRGISGIPTAWVAIWGAGKPVIACLNGEGARIVVEAEAGIACPAGDDEALAAAVIHVCGLDDDARRKMGENGRRYADRHFGLAWLTDDLIGRLKALSVQRREASQ